MEPSTNGIQAAFIRRKEPLLERYTASWIHPKVKRLRELRARAENHVDQRCAGILPQHDRRCVVYATLTEWLSTREDHDPSGLQFLEEDLDHRVRARIIEVIRDVLWELTPTDRTVLIWGFSLERFLDPPMVSFANFPEGQNEYEAVLSSALKNLKVALFSRSAQVDV